MMTEEEKLLRILKEAFPQGIIYADEYFLKDMKGIDFNKKNRGFGYSVRRLSKAVGLSREEWLSERGFVWKETGYVEPDMKTQEAERRGSGAFAVADYVLRTYPLAGEYIPTPSESEELYQTASRTVQNLFLEGGDIRAQDYVVLTLETILLSKGWTSGCGADTFWSYIYQQYGFHSEGRSDAEQRIYAQFRKAIQFTLEKYNRFFAPSHKQRYYTSLMLHALSPRQSIEALFNILFDFYARSLDFQYVTEDISYKVFTRGMQARWNSKIVTNDTLQLRSDTLFSGLQTLFEERPCYMAYLCDSIVSKIDALVRGDGRIALHEDRNYWDLLLLEWYKKKSRHDRQALQGERRSKKMEYVASSRDRIYVRYAMQDAMVGLEVPRIRLPEVANELPLLLVRQNDRLVLQRRISVTGNDLCLTTRSVFVPLRDMELDFAAPLVIHAVIQYGNNELYHSGTRLHRSYLLFDSDGRERRTKTGTAWLFAGSGQHVDFAGEADIFQEPHPGQLYRINLSGIAAVAVDGAEVFADEKTAARFRCHTTAQCVGWVRADDQGGACEIYRDAFSLTIHIPKGDQILRYQLLADGRRVNGAAAEGEAFRLRPPCEAGVPHSVQVADIVSGHLRLEYRYMILPGFSMRLNASLYRENVDAVSLNYSWQGCSGELSVPAPVEGGTVQITVPSLQTPLDVDVPVVHCTFLGRSAFSAPRAVWHQDIPAGEFVALSLPENWSGGLMLGTGSIPADQTGRRYELGNALRSGIKHERTEPLLLSLKSSQGVAEKYLITEIVFSSGFLKEPLRQVEGQLCWRFAGNFHGEKNPRFLIECTGADGTQYTFSAEAEDRVLAESGTLPDGKYFYQVYLKARSVFGSKKVERVADGSFVVGDPLQYLFAGKELHLRSALCWDYETDGLKNKAIRPESAILGDFIYRDTCTPSGEALPSPAFEATLYFTDKSGARHPFSFQDDGGFEQINPVHVWVVNEHLLILHCATEDGVQLDNQKSTLINLDPDCYLSRKEQYRRLETPDYFQYEVREG